VSRPHCYRRVAGRPAAAVFKPIGIPVTRLEETVMTLDEFEAIRLADLDGLYQERAAEEMGISRSTFSRLIDGARRKVADALVHGKALRIEGGPVHTEAYRCCHLHGKRRPSLTEA
jgi:predicted DNA-binding protein (UPF0251 family)